jgi:hypothetical protein
VTPEYPNGTYAYFATVDSNWNSAYPYVVGPTFYGTRVASTVTSITETTTTYVPITTSVTGLAMPEVSVYPNPSAEFFAVQFKGLNKEEIQLELLDSQGRVVQKSILFPGMTLVYFDTSILYSDLYLLRMSGKFGSSFKKIMVAR